MSAFVGTLLPPVRCSTFNLNIEALDSSKTYLLQEIGISQSV